jgi:hypothetical protein
MSGIEQAWEPSDEVGPEFALNSLLADAKMRYLLLEALECQAHEKASNMGSIAGERTRTTADKLQVLRGIADDVIGLGALHDAFRAAYEREGC